jgi:hypothetical protein
MYVLVTLPKKTFIVDPCTPLNLCIDTHAFSSPFHGLPEASNPFVCGPGRGESEKMSPRLLRHTEGGWGDGGTDQNS